MPCPPKAPGWPLRMVTTAGVATVLPPGKGVRTGTEPPRAVPAGTARSAARWKARCKPSSFALGTPAPVGAGTAGPVLRILPASGVGVLTGFLVEDAPVLGVLGATPLVVLLTAWFAHRGHLLAAEYPLLSGNASFASEVAGPLSAGGPGAGRALHAARRTEWGTPSTQAPTRVVRTAHRLDG